MKRHFKSIILAAALSAFAGAFASAQYLQEVAKVPFSFHAAGKVIPAGKLSVKEVDAQGLYSLTDSTGNSSFWNAGIKRSANPAKPHLTFACYGHECVLAEVSMPGKNVASGASQATIDRELSHNIGVASMISVPFGTR